MARPFWGPLVVILDFAGGTVVQAVWRYRWYSVAGDEQVPSALLRLIFQKFVIKEKQKFLWTGVPFLH